MPYDIKKRPCKKSDGTSGKWIKSYKPKKGKRKGQTVTSCHSTETAAEKSIAAIEAGSGVKESIDATDLESLIRQLVRETLAG